MKTLPIEIREYITAEGKIPFREWLRSLRDNKAKAKVTIRINRVRLGNLGDTKGVGNGVHELRIKYGPGYRVYYGHEGKQIVLLLCGGDKSTQKKDIKLAHAYWTAHTGGK